MSYEPDTRIFETRSSKLLRSNPLRTNISSQGLRDDHTPVGLLVVLYNRDPGPSDGQCAAIQCVYKFCLVLAFGTEPYIRPPRLIGLEIRARRNLAVQLLSRQPDLDIVRLRRRRSHITRAERHGAVMQTESLQNFFRVTGQLLMFLVRAFRMRKLHQFHFLKLMLPDDSANVLPIRSCFATEAWCICGN